MSYSYNCPDPLPYSCGQSCCFVAEYDDEGFIVGWKKCCGCTGNNVCPEPVHSVHFFSQEDLRASSGLACTDCSPLGDIFFSQRIQSAIQAAHTNAEFGLLRVQKVDQPATYDTTLLTFTGDTKIIITSGWTVFFQRLPGPLRSSSAVAQVLPPQLPHAPIVTNEKFLTAMVVLPEARGSQQYIVTVLESSVYTRPEYRYAQLLTGEWSVLFLRAPAVEKECDCGCGDSPTAEPAPEVAS